MLGRSAGGLLCAVCWCAGVLVCWCAGVLRGGAGRPTWMHACALAVAASEAASFAMAASLV